MRWLELKHTKQLCLISPPTTPPQDIKRLNNTMDMLNKRKNINMMKMNGWLHGEVYGYQHHLRSAVHSDAQHPPLAMALVLKEFFSHQKQSYSFTLDDAIFGALAVALRSRFSEEVCFTLLLQT